jgi:putative acetyltransferase
MPNFSITPDDLASREIAELLADHLREMNQHSPPESVHALDLDKLKQPEITFWSIWSVERVEREARRDQIDADRSEISRARCGKADAPAYS